MPRGNGSYIGIDANPNANVASGIWTVREAETHLRANKWPATPAVPGAPTVIAGNEQVSLAWTAPSGGSTPTDYEVQYSSNGGSSWTTFSDGVSTATSATVTGLTNGTGYIFRVRAVNALGEGPYGSASGTATPTALNVALLLHFDGENNSTTFTDSSGNSVSVVAYDGAAISTAESKFGGASAGFSGNYAQASGLSSWDAGTEPFTLEFWAYVANTNSLQMFVTKHGGEGSWDQDDGLSLEFYVDSVGTVSCGYRAGGDRQQIDSDVAIPDGTWVHLALAHDGSALRMFIDGVEQTQTGVGLMDSVPEADILEISGNINGSAPMTGYIDELRVVQGAAVYTGNFTPPTGPF